MTWDLREENRKAEFLDCAWKAIKKRKDHFTSRELARHLECTMQQARVALNVFIGEGRLGYEGQTRSTVYFVK